MDICVDCETAALDTHKFVAACIRIGTKTEIYYNKTDTWNRILELGEKVKNRRECLNVYAHNHAYDFLCYADLKDRNIKIFSDSNPFIVAYGKEREYIKFMDTFSIFPMSLKELGESIGVEKGELTQDFKEKDESIYMLQKKIRENIDNMQDYLKRDTLIPLMAIASLKNKLKSMDIKLMRLITISQISIGVIMNKLYRDNRLDEDNFWYDRNKRKVHRTVYREEIHGAYRGARVECFGRGVYSDNEQMFVEAIEKGIEVSHDRLDYADVNSLYPWCISKMRIPNLKSERKIKTPLKNFDMDYILKKIGVSRALIRNDSNEIGLIPVRTPNGNYYPMPGKMIIGTYTNMELEKARNNGYTIMDIEWSVLWDDIGFNPFSRIYEQLYELKSKGGSFDRLFYKLIMNSSIGRMAMQKPRREFVIDSISKAEEYLDNMYKIVQAKENKYMYSKEIPKSELKPHYMPIIPCLVNAYARCRMYDDMVKIGKENLVYHDSDSIIAKRKAHIWKILDVGEEMGRYKMVNENSHALIFGRKTYMIGDEIKISGMRKKGITNDMFLKGYVENVKMITLKSAKTIEEAGSFIKEGRDLYLQYHENKEISEKMEENRLYIDEDIENIRYFSKIIG